MMNKLIMNTSVSRETQSYLHVILIVIIVIYLYYDITSIYNAEIIEEKIESISPESSDNNNNEWSATELLFLKAMIAALTSGLGGFPLYLVGELPVHVMGLCITFAAGLMSGCSVVLFMEAIENSTSIISVFIYTLIGILLIHTISYFVEDVDEFKFAGLKGASASKAFLIVLSMGLHSLGEGISVGVSATNERESIGLLVIISLA
eukprot:33910_1